MPFLATSTSPATAARADRVLVVPLGATEQHGPHLPVTTDTDIALALTERLAQALPGHVVVAPALPFGSSGEHQAFAGTLSLGQDVTERLLVELGRSATCTWRRMLLVSTHGGNDGPVRRAVRLLRGEGRDVRSWMPAWGGDAHAGRTETSLMLALAPDRVQLAAAEAGTTTELAKLLPVLAAKGVAAVSPNGVLGDPTSASAAEGRRIIDAAVASLRATVCEWPERDRGDRAA